MVPEDNWRRWDLNPRHPAYEAGCQGFGKLGPALTAEGEPPSERASATVTREPAGEYHQSPGISCSQLKVYSESPLAYYLRFVARVSPPRVSAAMRAGTLLHARHELADEWPSRIEIAPDSVVTSTGQLAKAGDKWLADLGPDRIGLTQAELDSVNAQWEGVLRNPAAARLIAERVDAEFNVRWSMNGHAMRCRTDGATPELWYDLKTTREVSPRETFRYAVRDYGYDLQAAIYADAAVAAGWPHHRLVFVVISTAYPHLCSVVRLPPEVIRRARDRVLRYLDEIREREAFSHWLPDDYGEIVDLPMDNWR